jgi:hypothetical protein
MSSTQLPRTSSAHHIPFPRTFLSLNTPAKKAPGGAVLSTSPESEFTTHGFLSNRPVAIPSHPRNASISSVSSVDSVASSAPLPATNESPTSPTLDGAATTFLALNTKYTAPPPSTKEMSDDKSNFLSNRH